MKAIGSRNAAKSMQKQVEGQIMQLKALFNEKLMELDRQVHFIPDGFIPRCYFVTI